MFVAVLLTGCAGQSQDATFIGYSQRPTDVNTTEIAIVQLESGEPAQAECTYTTLENGTPVKVQKTDGGYKVVSVSPDWK